MRVSRYTQWWAAGPPHYDPRYLHLIYLHGRSILDISTRILMGARPLVFCNLKQGRNPRGAPISCNEIHILSAAAAMKCKPGPGSGFGLRNILISKWYRIKSWLSSDWPIVQNILHEGKIWRLASNMRGPNLLRPGSCLLMHSLLKRPGWDVWWRHFISGQVAF